MTNTYKRSVIETYSEFNDMIIIGLTGRTGSGCTTTAKILTSKTFNALSLPKPKNSDFKTLEERKYSVIYNYMKNNWSPFTIIEASSIIISYILEKPFEDFVDFIKKLSKNSENSKFRISGENELIKRLEGLRELFGCEDYKYIDNNIEEIINEKSSLNKFYELYVNRIKNYKRSFYDVLKDYSCFESSKSYFYNSGEKKFHLYTYLLQIIGNNIRCSGEPYKSDFNETYFNTISKRICNIIRIIKEYNSPNNKKTCICVDALRNPYEVYYLKDRFASFYLMSVSTEDSERKRRLSYLDNNQLLSLDDMEYPSKKQDRGEIFYQQSIAECLQISDIHLYNPYISDNKYKELKKHLVKYVALMNHPGLVQPTSEERCMQIAYSAKLNSGCLSRQVGAVITDEDYSLKAIGWNEVPEGQVPCSLRSINNYFFETDKSTFSEFEIGNKSFCTIMENLNSAYANQEDIKEYTLSFCFKDIYNGIKNDKNQVHTRALHAEENAFLQISKYGGQGIQNGKLFVTASPCELCSKKSYQLGIKEIYYIDPYPGISASHILKLGESNKNPKLKLFYGVIGMAYIKLYSQRFSQKDELQLVSGIDVKSISKKKDLRNNNTEYDDLEYNSIILELLFKNRHEIEFSQDVTVVAKKDNLSTLQKKMNWSGSSYDKTILDEETFEYAVSDDYSSEGVNYYTISKEVPLKTGEEFHYKLKTYARDEGEIMNTILSHHVKSATKTLSMSIKFDKKTYKNLNVSNVRLVLYADINKNIIYKTISLEPFVDNDEYLEYKKDIDEPYLLYAYSIEWDF